MLVRSYMVIDYDQHQHCDFSKKDKMNLIASILNKVIMLYLNQNHIYQHQPYVYQISETKNLHL